MFKQPYKHTQHKQQKQNIVNMIKESKLFVLHWHFFTTFTT